MNKEIMIGNHKISEDSPTFVIAEMSANHLMDLTEQWLSCRRQRMPVRMPLNTDLHPGYHHTGL